MDAWLHEAADREGWSDAVGDVEAALTDLRIALEPHDAGVRIVDVVEPGAYERLDQTKTQPTRLAVWKIIEREKVRVAEAEDETLRSKDASERLKRQRLQAQQQAGRKPPG